MNAFKIESTSLVYTLMMVVVCTLSCWNTCEAFLPSSHQPLSQINTLSLVTKPLIQPSYISKSILKSTESSSSDSSSSSSSEEFKLPESTLSESQEMDIQWDLFTKHHMGKWRGIWTSYNYMGDVIDETIASVNLELDSNQKEEERVVHTHEIATSATTSSCSTCFDSTTTKTIPISTYTPSSLSTKKWRTASIGMIHGPSLLRTGTMSTELILSHGNGRIRTIYQHAPVWEAGISPGSCPPHGLKLFRVLVSRETRDTSGPPTRESEGMEEQEVRGNPVFFRGVPPFLWHKKWAGTSWTWGPQSGDRGWSITDLEEADAWHGRPTGDTADVWSMRLPGGILLQCPRIITSGYTGLCRLAWLPEDDAKPGTSSDGDTAKLLRIEAAVSALEPIIDEDNEELMVGFYPPSLSSLRCDALVKIGELENTSMLEKLRNMGEMSESDVDGMMDPRDENEIVNSENDGDDDDDDEGGDDSGIEAIRNALKL